MKYIISSNNFDKYMLLINTAKRLENKYFNKFAGAIELPKEGVHDFLNGVISLLAEHVYKYLDIEKIDNEKVTKLKTYLKSKYLNNYDSIAYFDFTDSKYLQHLFTEEEKNRYFFINFNIDFYSVLDDEYMRAKKTTNGFGTHKIELPPFDASIQQADKEGEISFYIPKDTCSSIEEFEYYAENVKKEALKNIIQYFTTFLSYVFATSELPTGSYQEFGFGAFKRDKDNKFSDDATKTLLNESYADLFVSIEEFKYFYNKHKYLSPLKDKILNKILNKNVNLLDEVDKIFYDIPDNRKEQIKNKIIDMQKLKIFNIMGKSYKRFGNNNDEFIFKEFGKIIYKELGGI